VDLRQTPTHPRHTTRFSIFLRLPVQHRRVSRARATSDLRVLPLVMTNGSLRICSAFHGLGRIAFQPLLRTLFLWISTASSIVTVAAAAYQVARGTATARSNMELWLSRNPSDVWGGGRFCRVALHRARDMFGHCGRYNMPASPPPILAGVTS